MPIILSFPASPQRGFLHGLLHKITPLILIPLSCVLSIIPWDDAFCAETTPAPNIIFILADDLGFTDIGCYGTGYYETPNIDRLASQGVSLKNHHHCQNCAPTRAALMTGQYGPRTGVYTVGNIDRFNWQSRPLRPVDNVVRLPLDRSIIAHQLRQAGYKTGMFGKWHLGVGAAFHPGSRGFDEAIVSEGKHFNFHTNPPVEIPKGTYLADFLTDKAVDFIDRHQKDPFFLYLPHFGVHSPFQAKPELIAKFKDKPAVGGHYDPTYAAMIASVDESVGRVMKKLDDAGLTRNTIVIFASDNGGVGGYEREGVEAKSITDNAPLRSGKGSLYEGGTRVPFIVRWPGVVPEGKTSNVPTIHVDLYPTLLEVTGAAKPQHVLDGQSMVAVWKDPAKPLIRDGIFQHFPGYLGSGGNTFRTLPVATVTQGDWKLMQFMEDGRLELYNLASDIGEKKNLAKEDPQRAEALLKVLKDWQVSIHAPMPTPNTPMTDGENVKGKPKGKGKGKKKLDRPADADDD